MPSDSSFVPAESVLTHQGVTVYHTYKDDDIEQGPRAYWFVLRSTDGDTSPDSFDVRSFDVPSAALLNGGVSPTDQASGASFRDMSEAEFAAARAAIDQWHTAVEPALILAVLREAIEAGLLVAPTE